MEERIQQLEEELTQLKAEFYKERSTVEFIFRRNLALIDVDLKLSSATGTKIGTSATQKLGFFNKTPVIQPSAIASPSGGATIDSQARTAIDLIRTALTNLGLTA